MNDPSILNLMNNQPDQFRLAISRKTLPQLWFREISIKFDFSGLIIEDAKFSKCDLQATFTEAKLSNCSFRHCTFKGTLFLETTFDNCDFEESDWTGCTFTRSHFSSCNFERVQNAHLAMGLAYIDANNTNKNFETAIRPIMNQYLDWERIKIVGRLPLFAASSIVLIIYPVFFYLLDLFNRYPDAWKKALEKSSEASVWAEVALNALNRFGKLPIPPHALETLITAMILFVASGLFLFFCPARIKQFSSEEWCKQLGQPIITYWPFAWHRPRARILSAVFYAIGGLLAMHIILTKLVSTVIYVWRNL